MSDKKLIQILVNPDEEARIKASAKALGSSIAPFIRSCVLRECMKIQKEAVSNA